MPDVQDAVRAEMCAHRVGVLPEFVDEGWVDEDHLAPFEIVGERLAEHQWHKAAERADGDDSPRPDCARQAVVDPPQPEIEIVGPLTVAHSQQVTVLEKSRRPVAHSFIPYQARRASDPTETGNWCGEDRYICRGSGGPRAAFPSEVSRML